jgi:16S rRNA (cytosine1402-N4)-methyltransferase
LESGEFRFEHKPVLLDECIDGLNIKPGGIYIDCTLGGGGHSEAIARRLKNGRLLGIDRDADAIAAASGRLEKYKDVFTACQGDFGDLAALARSQGISQADGILFDLGVSSYQIDNPARGFSYREDALLDMRMDASAGQTAAELVATADYGELCRILRDYGEERFAARIAAEIVKRRAASPIDTTFKLRDVVASAIPAAAARKEKQHPAKRTFQALRIAVNRELDSVERGVRAAIELAAPGGRICVISFHSLEDRIVKNIFAQSVHGCTCPRDFPVCVCGAKAKIRLITKRPLTASRAELDENPRSHSAKLRITEKL